MIGRNIRWAPCILFFLSLASVSLAVFSDKIVPMTYDDFDDNSFNTSLWNKSSTILISNAQGTTTYCYVSETGGNIKLYAQQAFGAGLLSGQNCYVWARTNALPMEKVKKIINSNSVLNEYLHHNYNGFSSTISAGIKIGNCTSNQQNAYIRSISLCSDCSGQTNDQYFYNSTIDSFPDGFWNGSDSSGAAGGADLSNMNSSKTKWCIEFWLNVPTHSSSGSVRRIEWDIDMMNYSRYIESKINISNITCSSCNLPLGNMSMYMTSDTTPNLSFITNDYAFCRIGSQNLNWTGMGESKECSSDTNAGYPGNIYHVCTIPESDELTNPIDDMYISCKNAVGDEIANATVKLDFGVTDLIINRTRALYKGVKRSSVWPGASVFFNYPVYLKGSGGNILYSVVDTVVINDDRVWLFNYDNYSADDLFNVSNGVYVKELKGNLSYSGIMREVSSLINSTRMG